MNPLLELADRVEAATGPDRELDCLIWLAKRGLEPEWVGAGKALLTAEGEGVIGWIDPGVTQRNFGTGRATTGPNSIPAYTGSLDASMTLAPEGWTFANLSQSDGRKWWCELRRGYLTSYDRTAFSRQLNNVSPAHAVTAASLRAIASMGSSG